MFTSMDAWEFSLVVFIGGLDELAPEFSSVCVDQVLYMILELIMFCLGAWESVSLVVLLCLVISVGISVVHRVFSSQRLSVRRFYFGGGLRTGLYLLGS